MQTITATGAAGAGTGAAAPANSRPAPWPRGFSLIEMMLVLVIIGFIAAMVASNMIQRHRAGLVKQAGIGLQRVATELQTYVLDTGTLPARLDHLLEDPANVQGWAGPYLTPQQLVDPWGRPYVLKVPGPKGREFELVSLGADGAEGGSGHAADLGNWQ